MTKAHSLINIDKTKKYILFQFQILELIGLILWFIQCHSVFWFQCFCFFSTAWLWYKASFFDYYVFDTFRDICLLTICFVLLPPSFILLIIIPILVYKYPKISFLITCLLFVFYGFYSFVDSYVALFRPPKGYYGIYDTTIHQSKLMCDWKE
eukprot:UN25887